MRSLLFMFLIAGAATAAAPVVPGTQFLAEPDAGELLIGELNCIACHAAGTASGRLSAKPAPILTAVGSRLPQDVIRAFAGDPHVLKPGTTMPKLPLTATELDLVAAYLAGLRTELPAAVAAADAPERGRQLFHAVGCIACHAPDPDFRPAGLAATIELPAAVRLPVPIALAHAYTPTGLTAFLRAPLEVRPGGRMPDMNLSGDEAIAIAAYLRPAGIAAPPPQPSSAGARLFQENCASCHLPDAATPQKKAPALASLHSDKGCLASSPQAPAVDYQLSPQQRTAIAAALVRLGNPPQRTAADRVHQTMARLNCYACHKRDAIGGIDPSVDPLIQPALEVAIALGDEGRLPPPLTGIGRKLTAAWLQRVLTDPPGTPPFRTCLAIRMPRFGTENIHALLTDFAAADPPNPAIAINTDGTAPHNRAFIGRQLMGSKGLNCITCHGLKGQKSLGVPAVDLTLTAQRLRPEWFKALLLDPASVRPGTRMPAFFKDGKSAIKAPMSGDDAAKQIEQIWTYLKEGDQLALPDGMDRGSSELKPDTRPIVFRTFMEAAGTEAIAIGFPQQVHVVFDSHDIRWAVVWRGRFLDAEVTWQDRFSPLTPPLGTDVKTLPAGPTVAILADPTAKWPAQPDGIRFLGYRFDDRRIPTLLYSLAGVTVEDRLMPADAGRALERVTHFTGRQVNFYLRGLDGTPRAVDLTTGNAEIREHFSW